MGTGGILEMKLEREKYQGYIIEKCVKEILLSLLQMTKVMLKDIIS